MTVIYFPFLAFCSLWCLGFFAITRKGKLFDFVDAAYSKLLGATEAQQKVNDGTAIFLDHVKVKVYDIFGCVTCLSSTQTLILYFFFCHVTDNNFVFWHWVAVSIPCAFLNEFLWQLRTTFVKRNEIADIEIKHFLDASD
jgi:hypothetical protein